MEGKSIETRVSVLEILVQDLRDTMRWTMRGALVTAIGTVGIFLTQLIQGGHHP